MRPSTRTSARTPTRGALPLAAALLLLLVAPSLACPESCACDLDRKGRHRVLCNTGDGKDPMPLPGPGDRAEVFEVGPPPDRPNYFTIGPIFGRHHRQLEELHIVHSNLPAIGLHSFHNLPNLQVLNLTHNNMSAVVEHNFSGLKALRDLFLSDNRIESVPSSAFHHLEDVRRISLARNRMRELSSRIFFKLAHLQDLDLSYNPLHELNTDVFRDVPELRVLRCRGCGVSAVNKTLFEVLPDLEVLDLGDNKLTAFTAEYLAPLKQLQELWLDGNQLAVLPSGVFRHNGQLQTLDVSRNQISKVEDEAFLDLVALRTLDLGYNRLERLHASVVAPRGESLRALVLAGNVMTTEELARLLRGVPHLTRLSLADMRLRSVPMGLLAPLRELRLLNVSGNMLTALHPSALHSLLKLDTVDASRNHLVGLDEQSLLRLDAVELVLLDGNHWSCDTCHLPPLLSRVARSAPTSPLRRLRCDAPRSLAGKPLANLELESLKWCSGGMGVGPDSPRSLLSADSQLGVIAAAAAVALLILAGAALLAVVAYSKHHADYYYTHEDKLGPEREAIFENMGAVIDDRASSKKAPKRVTIATIDELTKDPELHGLTNGA
ncbi:insulin-like growth factor-binding protein complex acid labile subunit [Thrips palmi]|uniref:Insulin-like growth factor-binding protein complex acid labile subunit n=1 Tax=Thrips palmi TaxID=161013 RepID=A0A6P8Z664_THRPL|nr:insulin-like growth factor-binding protein complex acid labile subunit [Thrips palmi]